MFKCYSMKKIGIIGGLSAESTIEYYKIIVREYNKIMGDSSSPLLVIDSLDLEELRSLAEEDKWEEVFKIIYQSVKDLEKVRVELIILATNTIHKIFDKLKKKAKVPMISIMDATAEAIKKQNIKKVGLLGTIFTMQSDFYQNAFLKHNLEIIVPDQEDQEFVNKVIWEELTYHILKPESKKCYLEVIERLREKGAEGIILGCTEIPLLIQQEDTQIPIFDTTSLHALAALNFALSP